MPKIRPYVSQVKTDLPLPSPYEGEVKRSYQFIDGVLYQVEVTVVASSEDVIVPDSDSSSVPFPSLISEINEDIKESSRRWAETHAWPPSPDYSLDQLTNIGKYVR